ncbi:MAG: hypothetical protein QMB70_06275, partial [Aeromonadaceae bacterium]
KAHSGKAFVHSQPDSLQFSSPRPEKYEIDVIYWEATRTDSTQRGQLQGIVPRHMFSHWL